MNENETLGLRESHRNIFDRTVKLFADKAYRTILVAYRDLSLSEYNSLSFLNN